tara:strand:+ start:675 stop:1610 length:936 start_codon:yes stop_codon:yes gene_type:complete
MNTYKLFIRQFFYKLIKFLKKKISNPHTLHFYGAFLSFMKDYREKKESIIITGLVRAFSTYLPRPFLLFSRIRKDQIDIQELRSLGYQKIDPLNPNEVKSLNKLFLESLSGYYGLNFKNIDHLRKYMEENQIQRSKVVHATPKTVAINSIVSKKILKQISISYLRKKPQKLNFISYIFALAKVDHKDQESKNALVFHRDVDHFRFCKFFYFLSDCQIGGGHHEFIEKTHKKRKIRVAPNGRYELDFVLNTYNKSKVVKIFGKAGDGFVEDTSGFHRGTPIEKGFRILLMIEILPNSISRDNYLPFPVTSVN